jgi:hypothetical protein
MAKLADAAGLARSRKTMSRQRHRLKPWTASSGMKLAIAAFIIRYLSWQARKPEELDQSFVRVARHSPGVLCRRNYSSLSRINKQPVPE